MRSVLVDLFYGSILSSNIFWRLWRRLVRTLPWSLGWSSWGKQEAFPPAVWPELQSCNIACVVDEVWPDPEDADSHSLYKLFFSYCFWFIFERNGSAHSFQICHFLNLTFVLLWSSKVIFFVKEFPSFWHHANEWGLRLSRFKKGPKDIIKVVHNPYVKSPKFIG